MRKLKATKKAVRFAAVLGFLGIMTFAGAGHVFGAEGLPDFDNQGRKVYKALQSTPPANLSADSWGRTLNDFYKLRQYPGSPPRIPHEVEPAFSGKEPNCLSCHEQGGYSPEYDKFAPVTPHPENTLCYQCHTVIDTDKNFVENDWQSIQPPKLGRSALAGSPPVIPHSLQMRENCVACHTGPGAVVEIRISHAERGDCRQCHVQVIQTEPLEVFTRK